MGACLGCVGLHMHKTHILSFSAELDVICNVCNVDLSDKQIEGAISMYEAHGVSQVCEL